MAADDAQAAGETGAASSCACGHGAQLERIEQALGRVAGFIDANADLISQARRFTDPLGKVRAALHRGNDGGRGRGPGASGQQ